MTSVITSVLALIVTLGILIAFHEYGHFWVARKMGVKVLRFSIGFGKPLFTWIKGKDKTEYVIAAIPLGGYVKMLDEREGNVDDDEMHRAFNRQPVSKRIAIVIAGPAFNFIFAILAYFIMYTVGVPGVKPEIGSVAEASIASRAGIKEHDQIIAVESKLTPTWSSVRMSLLEQSLDKDIIVLEVIDAQRDQRKVELQIASLTTEMKQGNLLRNIGISPYSPVLDPVIGELKSGGAATRDGLKENDLILTANNIPVIDWSDWVKVIRQNPKKPINVEYKRNGIVDVIVLIPESHETKSGDVIGRIGALPYVPEGFMDDYRVEESYPIGEAFIVAIEKTWSISILTLRMLGKMVTGELSVKNLSGPITIATYAGYTASIGPTVFLSFLAVVSIGLGVLNLLPIPLLDGGHLLYYVIEIVKGSELSEVVQGKMQQVGIVLLAMLMLLAFYNDIQRLIGG